MSLGASYMYFILIYLSRIIKFFNLWFVVEYLILSKPIIKLLAYLLALNLKCLFDNKKNDRINILVFNSYRWKTDLRVLYETKKVNLIDFKRSYISF